MGEVETIFVMSMLIKDVLQFVKHDKTHWNEDVISGCAEMLLETYWHMKIDEFTLCFKRGIKGDYGIIYDKIAYTDLASWLNQYDAQKVREMRRVDQQQVSEATKLENEDVIESYRQHYKAWQERIANKEQIEVEAKKENAIRSASALVKAMDRTQLKAFRERMKDKGSEVLAVIDQQLNRTK